MRRWLCSWRGHKWESPTYFAPKHFVCRRCGETGSWVPS